MQQEFVQNLKNLAEKAVNAIHTALPGVIKSFDSSTGLATITPKAKYKKPNGETIDYPDLYNVPVCLPNSGDVMIAFPIEAGDSCLVICSEIPLDLWRYGKETETDLKYDLTSAIAIPNISAESNDAIKLACEENAVVVKTGDNTVKINGEEILVTTENATVTIDDDSTKVETEKSTAHIRADTASIKINDEDALTGTKIVSYSDHVKIAAFNETESSAIWIHPTGVHITGNLTVSELTTSLSTDTELDSIVTEDDDEQQSDASLSSD